MNGGTVAAFEREFASYVGAKYAIALCNGTATLHAALAALGVQPGDRVAVPPLTMASTTIAVLHAGAVPVFCDVDEQAWLMGPSRERIVQMPVSLYGVHAGPICESDAPLGAVNDAAQTVMPYKVWGQPAATFVSYSFQASKILALGEGGMLVTDDEALATRARQFSSLGYRMRADQPRIDPATLKAPSFARHHSLGWNYRMADAVAAHGLEHMEKISHHLTTRRLCADRYRDAIAGCDWLTPQHVRDGWPHDYWSYAVTVDTPERWQPFADAIVRCGGTRPFAAWRLTYQEPAFRHLTPDGTCPVAESLQPRIVAFQTNDLASAERNASAVSRAIEELS